MSALPSWIGVALALVCGACTPAQSPNPDLLVESHGSARPAPPVIKILDPGEGPRRKLRYDFRSVASHALQIEIASASRDEAAGSVTIRARVDLEPAAPIDGGDIRFWFRLTRASLVPGAGPAADPATTAKVEAALAETTGTRGSLELTERGIVRELGWGIHGKRSVAAQQVYVDLGRALKQAFPVLPEEAVASGARWSVDSDVSSSAFKMASTTEYKLTALEDMRVELAVAVRQSAPAQPYVMALSNASKTRPARVELQSFKGEGAGKVTIFLDRARTQSSVKLSVETRLLVEERKGWAMSNVALYSSSSTTCAPLE